MASLAAVNDTLKANNDNIVTGDTMIVQAVDRLHVTMQSFVKMVQLQNMKLLEAMREQQPAQAAGGADSPDVSMPESNIGKLLAGIAALLIGFFTGLGDSIKKLLSLARMEGAIARVAKAIDGVIDSVRAVFRGLVTSTKAGPLGMLVDGVKTNFTEIFDFIKNSVFGRIVTGIKNLLVFPFEGLFVTPGEANILTRIKNAIFGPFQKVFNAIRGIFTFAVEGSGLMKILGSIGKVLGRLFAPFAIIMTIFDTVKGAIAGFEEDGIVGAIAGGITGLLNSIIGMPLDLLKGAVAYMLDFFGAESAAEYLRGFSFQDVIAGAVNAIKNFFTGIIDGLIEGIAVAADVFGQGDKIRQYKFNPDTKADREAADAATDTSTADSFMDESFSPEPVQKAIDEAVAEKEKKPNKFDRIQAKMERNRQRQEARGIEPVSRDQVVSSFADNSQRINNVAQSNQSMIAPMATPFDRKDPAMQTVLGALN